MTFQDHLLQSRDISRFKKPFWALVTQIKHLIGGGGGGLEEGVGGGEQDGHAGGGGDQALPPLLQARQALAHGRRVCHHSLLTPQNFLAIVRDFWGGDEVMRGWRRW